MASWGRTADGALTGTMSTTSGSNTITGVGTLFTTELEIENIIIIGTDVYRVTSINSDLEVLVEPSAPVTVTGSTGTVSDAPQYLPVDEIDNVVYVETAEIDANTRADGVKTPGWTLYEEYGSGRKRVETLVAMKSTT